MYARRTQNGEPALRRPPQLAIFPRARFFPRAKVFARANVRMIAAALARAGDFTRRHVSRLPVVVASRLPVVVAPRLPVVVTSRLPVVVAPLAAARIAVLTPLAALTLLPALMLLAGCGLFDRFAAGHGLPPLPPISGQEYRLGPGDVVRIITYGEDPLTGEFRVSDLGNVAVPLAGSVKASGHTPRELEDAIAAALKKNDMLRKPSVSVEVATYRSIYVLGEVNKPGQYPYQPGMTIVSAAAVAGGFTYRAVEDYASVVRIVDGDSLEGKASRQALVQPGDVITVFERKF
jgi:polysaccharide export outer membrane protein